MVIAPRLFQCIRQDRQAVERACGDLDRNAALFVPTLAPGEAIIIGLGPAIQRMRALMDEARSVRAA